MEANFIILPLGTEFPLISAGHLLKISGLKGALIREKTVYIEMKNLISDKIFVEYILAQHKKIVDTKTCYCGSAIYLGWIYKHLVSCNPKKIYIERVL